MIMSFHGESSKISLRKQNWKKGKHFNTISDWAVLRLDCSSGKIQSTPCPLYLGLALQDFS